MLNRAENEYVEPAPHAELHSFCSVVGPEADAIQMLSQAFTAALLAAVSEGVHARSPLGNLYDKERASAIHKIQHKMVGNEIIIIINPV